MSMLGSCGGTESLAHHVASHSFCPSGTWHDAIRLKLQRPEMVILNVGANKGFNLVEYAQRYTLTNLTKGRWKHLLQHVASPPCIHQCAGQCPGAVKLKRERRPTLANIRLAMHAFEAMPGNVKLLQQLVAATGIPASVHGVAVSNVSAGSVMVPVLESGSEKASVSFSSAARADGKGPTLTSVPTTSIDAFLDARSIERVSLVSIDTEGFDGLVLQGMARALAARRVDALEFEYSTKWLRTGGPHGLRDVLGRLAGAGYACFWQDGRGQLSEASGACWRERSAHFARGQTPYRNLVCSHRADVLATFRAIDVSTTCAACSTCRCAASSLDCREACALLEGRSKRPSAPRGDGG